MKVETTKRDFPHGKTVTSVTFSSTWPDGISRTNATRKALEEFKPPDPWFRPYSSLTAVHYNGTPDNTELQDLKEAWNAHLAFILKVAHAMLVVHTSKVLAGFPPKSQE